MAIPKHVLETWLSEINDNSLVAIDDGGINLVVVNDEEIYLEIGGVPKQD